MMLGLNRLKMFAVSVISSIIQIVVCVAHSHLDSFISHRYSLTALEILDRFRLSLHYYTSVKVQMLQRVKRYYNQFRGLPSSRGGYQSHGVTRILRHWELSAISEGMISM